MKRFGIIALVVVCAVVAAYVLWPSGSPVVYVSPASVDVPRGIVAGDPLELDLDVKETGRVRIIAISGASALVFTPELPEGRSAWTVPDAITRTAGRLTLKVADREFDVTISPGEPNAFTEVLLGPRTIVADGTDHTLAVVAPRDIHGNALPARTPLEFQRVTPQNDRMGYQREVERSLASVKLTAGTLAGRNSVWVTMGEATGVPAALNEVPGLASAVDLDLATNSVVADGRQVVELASGELVDAFGNQLPDGIAGIFKLDSGAATTVVPATVQRGRLRAFWTVPGEPAVLGVTASVNGRTSAPGTLTAVSGVGPFEVTGQLSSDGYLVTVGPLRSPSGALVADGTEAIIGGRSTTSSDGIATAVVQPSPGVISITVLGRTVEHRITP